jgi:hypothetical protein
LVIENRVWPVLEWGLAYNRIFDHESATTRKEFFYGIFWDGWRGVAGLAYKYICRHIQNAGVINIGSGIISRGIFGCKNSIFPRVAPSREVLFIGLVGQLIYIDGEDSSIVAGPISRGKWPGILQFLWPVKNKDFEGMFKRGGGNC